MDSGGWAHEAGNATWEAWWTRQRPLQPLPPVVTMHKKCPPLRNTPLRKPTSNLSILFVRRSPSITRTSHPASAVLPSVLPSLRSLSSFPNQLRVYARHSGLQLTTDSALFPFVFSWSYEEIALLCYSFSLFRVHIQAAEHC